MADTQSVVYGLAFGRNIMQLAQQKYAKLLPLVYMKPNVVGKAFFQDQIGEWSMAVKAGRNSQTPNNDPALARRMGLMVDYHDNRLLDRGDELKTISDPRSAYTIAAAASLGRQIDDVIIAAATGTAYSGETGATSVTNGNIVLATAASLTLARIAAVKKAFDDADVEMEDRAFIISTTALSSLLQQDKVASADYASVKALVRGEIDTYMGFKFITTTRLASGTVGIAVQKYGLCMAMAMAPMVKTDQRNDLSYSWQVYYALSCGAVRLEEDRVVWVKEG